MNRGRARRNALENSGRDAFAWGDQNFGQGGLTKREYIATMALQGMLANQQTVRNAIETGAGEELALAHFAVEQADALLLELEFDERLLAEEADLEASIDADLREGDPGVLEDLP